MGTGTWVRVEEAKSFAIAQCSFLPAIQIVPSWRQQTVELLLGEPVRVLGESTNWFYVIKIATGEKGIVPKVYLHQLTMPDFSIYKYSDTEICVPRRQPALEEATDALQEWHEKLKQFFIERKPDFSELLCSFQSLYTQRRGMVYQSLTVEEVKLLQKKFATIIDERNAALRSDLRVRDEAGLRLNPLQGKEGKGVSPIEFLRQHRESISRSIPLSSENQKLSNPFDAFALLVTVSADITKASLDHELKYYLHDGKQQISESAYFYLDSSAPEPKSNFKSQIIFTDLGKGDQNREKMFLVCTIIRHGPMEVKDIEQKKEPSKGKKGNYSVGTASQQLRRPCGVAIRDIAEITKNPSNVHSDEELLMTYGQFFENDRSLDETLRKLTTSDRNGKDRESNLKQWDIKCKVSTLPGASALEVAHRQQFVVVRKMDFPEVISPRDIRNELYVTLDRGVFHKGTGKTTDKNVEVTVTIHYDDLKEPKGGERQSQIRILPGRVLSEVPTKPFTSTVYYHESDPKWNETFIVQLPKTIDDFKRSHLRFTFKHKSTKESKDGAEDKETFAVAFLPFQGEHDTALADGEHSLAVYKLVQKYFKDKDKQLNYRELNPFKDLNGKKTTPGLVMDKRDEFIVRTKLCSLSFTQDEKLSNFLKWQSRDLFGNNSFRYSEIDNPSAYQARKDRLDNLKSILINLNKVAPMEYMKFLQVIFNKLFTILGDPLDVDIPSHLREAYIACEIQVFQSLLHIIEDIGSEKFFNFQSVVNHYIENEFHAALVYSKLMDYINQYLREPTVMSQMSVIDSFEFLFKFIVRSFDIRMEMTTFGGIDDDEDPEEELKNLIEDFFNCVKAIVSLKDKKFEEIQIRCLANLPKIINTLTEKNGSDRVHPAARQLVLHLLDVINQTVGSSLAIAQLQLIQDIVDSRLFQDKGCRTNILPIVISNVKPYLPDSIEAEKRPSVEYSNTAKKVLKRLGTEAIDSKALEFTLKDDMELQEQRTTKCIQLLSNVMNKLHDSDTVSVQDNISHMMQDLLESTITVVAALTSSSVKSKFIADVVAILLTFFDKMERHHYRKQRDALKAQDAKNVSAGADRESLCRFMENVLMSMKNLFSQEHFHPLWSDMILLQNSIIFKALGMLSEIIREEFQEPFNSTPWLSFFRCATAFITQESLQLQSFSKQKAASILKLYGDMRVSAAELVLNMWFSLGVTKKCTFTFGRFGLVWPFLEMSLVPERTVRELSMPVFYDMIRCEFDTSHPEDPSKKNFKGVESVFIQALVELFENGKGDRNYVKTFDDIMRAKCEVDTIGLRPMGLIFVDTIKRFLDLLLEFREVAGDEHPYNKMTCYVNLLDFSKQIYRNDLYMKYLYKLYDLQNTSKNYTEAAFVLKCHTKQLGWIEEKLPDFLISPLFSRSSTHMDLKERLYDHIINLFNRASMFECALEMCEELQQLYRDETYNYYQLPKLLREMATFYETIAKRGSLPTPEVVQRGAAPNPEDAKRATLPTPTYFLVRFHGKGFPSFLQNKDYIYRDKDLKMLKDFVDEIASYYPAAEIYRDPEPPPEELRNSSKQLLQIFFVKPVPGRRHSALKHASQAVRQYYKGNEVENFTLDRPFKYETLVNVNAFSTQAIIRHLYTSSSSFPGILSWFPVFRHTETLLRPIEAAVDFLLDYMEEVRNLIIEHSQMMVKGLDSSSTIGLLQMKVKGVLDAQVQGGFPNYEKAFLTEEYLEAYPDDEVLVGKLGDCIVGFIPVLREALEIHKIQGGPAHSAMHEYLTKLFDEFCEHACKTYGAIPEVDEELAQSLSRMRKSLEARTSRETKDDSFKNVPGSRNSDTLKHSSSIFRSTVSLTNAKPQFVSSSRLNNAKSSGTLSRLESAKAVKVRRATVVVNMSGERDMQHFSNTLHEHEAYLGLGTMDELSRSSESVKSSQGVQLRQNPLRSDSTSSFSRNRGSQRWSSGSTASCVTLPEPLSPSPTLVNPLTTELNSMPPPLPPKKATLKPDTIYGANGDKSPPPKPRHMS